MGRWASGRRYRRCMARRRAQRCWVHKTANVLNKLPKHLQAKAKSDLHQIWMAATRERAYAAFDHFVQSYEPKYPKAAQCLAKDKDPLLSFYDFPAEHWHHIRTSNPIESTFASVRNGIDRRLTDVHGHVIQSLLA